MKVVLDTNIFVSGIHWIGASDKILKAWILSKFDLVCSLPIIEEIIRVLLSFKIPMDSDDILWWEDSIFEKSILVIPTKQVDIVKDDPDDNKFIEAALEGKAEFIVSQDKHLLKLKQYKDTKIIHPKEFLDMLD